MAVWDQGPILLPYLQQELPRTLGDTSGLFDISSPYGYAGIWGPATLSDGEWKTFRLQFLDAMNDQGALSEFLRLSPVLKNHDLMKRMDSEAVLIRHNHTVAVPLRQAPDDYWANCKPSARSKVRKAQRLGYEATIRPLGVEDVAAGSNFRRLYEARMQVLGASCSYLFSDLYYRRLAEELSGSIFLAEVAAGDVVGAACILLEWEGKLHYHLSASDPQAARDGANNVMIDFAVRWGMEAGLNSFHLGGGIRDNDDLFKFKANFGGEHLEFWISQRVINPDLFGKISQKASKLGDGSDAKASGYFPPYRSG